MDSGYCLAAIPNEFLLLEEINNNHQITIIMSESTSTHHNQSTGTVDELKALIREAEAALSTAGVQVSDEMTGLRHRLRAALAEGKYTLDQAADLARKQVARADEIIRANPYASIGLATGAGVLVGFLIARSCNGRE